MAIINHIRTSEFASTSDRSHLRLGLSTPLPQKWFKYAPVKMEPKLYDGKHESVKRITDTLARVVGLWAGSIGIHETACARETLLLLGWLDVLESEPECDIISSLDDPCYQERGSNPDELHDICGNTWSNG